LNVNVTGRSEEVTPAMKQKAAEKVAKLLRFFDRITWVEVILDARNQRGAAEINAGLNRGATVVGKAEGADVYTAIDLAVDKMTRQLRRHKEKLKDRRPKRSAPPTGE
jgi:putative sigma-54 modulation protein